MGFRRPSRPRSSGFIFQAFHGGNAILRPERKSESRDLASELKRLAKEIDNLVNFISSGIAGDLDSVAGALREKEARKSDLEYEIDSLGSDDNDKVPLITPFAVKEKLGYMVEKICEKSDRFNGSLSALFDEPLQLSKSEGAFVLEGRVNVGAALSFQGVRQYRMAAGSNVPHPAILPPLAWWSSRRRR